MSRDDTLRAEQLAEQLSERLLQSVRRTVKPTRADAARNFAGVEARLGVALGDAASVRSEAPASTSGGDAPPPAAAPRGEELAASAGGTAATAGSSAAGAAGQGLPLAVKGAAVIAFGLVTGLAGYLMGRAEVGALRAPLALDPAVSEAPRSTPLQPAPLQADPAEVATLRAEDTPSAAPGGPLQHAARPASLDVRERSPRRSPSGAALLQRAAAAPRASSDPSLDLREALELLGRAEAALRRSDGLQARMWLSDLDRRAAIEVLLEERLVAATLASCLLGDVAAARRTLRELEQVNSESMYRARLEGSCVEDFVGGNDSKVASPAH